MTGDNAELTYVGPNQLEWRDSPTPGLSSDKAALVKPLAVATCDLDALIILGFSPFPPPFPLGHECVAEVVEIGDEVAAVETGQLVSVPFQISCGECEACSRGRTGNCTSVTRMATYGFGPAVAQWGGFLSERVLVPFADHMLVPLPPATSPLAAASVSDNLVDAWRAVGPALEREPGAPVLVVGGASSGSIGIYAAGLAVALGSRDVLYVDPSEHRRALARSLGARTFDEPWPKRLGPFPVTVDSSASADGIALALRSTAPDGECTSTSIFFGDPPPLPLLEMYTKITTFRTGRVHARPAIPRVLELIASGALHPELVTTRVSAWADAAEALSQPDWTKLVIARDAATSR